MIENKTHKIQLKLLPNFDHAIDMDLLSSFGDNLELNGVYLIDDIILGSLHPNTELKSIDKVSLRYNSEFRFCCFRIVEILNEDTHIKFIALPTKIIEKEVELYSLHNENDTLLFSKEYFNLLEEIMPFPTDENNEINLKVLAEYEKPSVWKGSRNEEIFFNDFLTDMRAFARRAIKDDAIVKIYCYYK